MSTFPIMSRRAGLVFGLAVLLLAGCGGGRRSAGDETSGVVPSGQVVYSRYVGTRQDLYVIGEDGQNQVPLATDAYYLGAANGRVIFVKPSSTPPYFYLYSIKADGSDPRVLSQLVNPNYGARLTASGSVIAYTGAGPVTMWRMNTELSGAVALAVSSATGQVFFCGETAGGKVVYNRRDAADYEVDIVNIDGTANTPLVTGQNAYCDAVTPRERVVFQRQVNGQSDLFSIKADGTGLVTLASSATESEGYRAVTANDRVIFTRLIGNQAGIQYDLFSINADGSGGEALLTNSSDPEFFVALTTGGRVVFRRLAVLNGLFLDDLYSINADGTGLVTLAASSDAEYYCGETSDNRIVFNRITASGGDVYLVNADGTGQVALRTGPEDESCAAVTPASRILFTRAMPGDQGDLYSINVDGGGLVPLADTPDNESYRGIF